jgi:hypothetical protein
MSTRRVRLPDPRETTVPQLRLSRFLDRDDAVVKLDVEGAEDAVLDDLVDSGAIRRVGQLLVEYHHHLDPERDFLDPFLARLREAGFRYHVTARQGVDVRAARQPVPQDVLVHAFR